MKMMYMVLVLMSAVSSAQAYNSFVECKNAAVAEADANDWLISTDDTINACGRYVSTAYDRCEAFRAGDGKWAQRFACSKDLKENEIILQEDGRVVDLNEYMGWTN